jgi:hypothetical protein
VDRIKQRVKQEYEGMIEATRMGTVFAHNLNAYRRWHAMVTRPAPGTPAPDDLKVLAQINHLAQLFPGQIIHGTI